MTKIYRESFGFFLASLPALLLFAVVIEGMLWVLQPKSEAAVTFGGLIVLAYFFHRHFLFGETLSLKNQKPGPDAPPFKFGWFVLISAGLVVVPVAVALAIAFQYPARQVFGVMVVVLFPLYLLILSLFGTAIPASVARDGTYRVSQGLRATFSTMWRLVLGPGVLGSAILAASVAAGKALESLQVPEDSLVTLAFYIMVRTMGFLTTIFAVAVLCEMYRKTRPGPHHGQGTGTLSQTPA